jgi:hypothetical protein
MASKKWVTVGIVLLIGALVLSACGGTAGSAAQTTPQGLVRTVTVVGQGKASGTPDVAHINIGVETSAASAQDAVNANKVNMNALLAKIKALGIADKDIQTSNFSIYTERSQTYPTDTKAGTPDSVLYRVSNQVNLTVRDVAKLGDILDQAVSAGANSIYGVYFSVEDTTALEAQAREKAVADAKSRAETLAKLNGVTVGQVVTISEVIGSSTPVYYSAAKADGLGGVPVEAGQFEVTMSVQVTYEIK